MTVCILPAVVFLTKKNAFVDGFTKYTMKKNTQQINYEIIFIRKHHFDKIR